jgi:hypothetical protein
LPVLRPPTGFGILVDTGDDNVVTRTKEDGIRIYDFDPTDPDIPNRTVVRGNAGVDGVRVDARSTDTVLERNSAFGAGDDGIEVDSASALLTRNSAWFDHDLGSTRRASQTAVATAPAETETGRRSASGSSAGSKPRTAPAGHAPPVPRRRIAALSCPAAAEVVAG